MAPGGAYMTPIMSLGFASMMKHASCFGALAGAKFAKFTELWMRMATPPFLTEQSARTTK